MNKITVTTTVNAPIEKVWSYWNEPSHIKSWYHASDDWGVGEVSNDLKVDGMLSIEMKANDGSAGFTLVGKYYEVKENESIRFKFEDNRDIEVRFSSNGNTTTVEEIFDPENENSEELQRGGWQAILDNFKKHVEGN